MTSSNVSMRAALVDEFCANDLGQRRARRRPTTTTTTTTMTKSTTTTSPAVWQWNDVPLGFDVRTEQIRIFFLCEMWFFGFGAVRESVFASHSTHDEVVNVINGIVVVGAIVVVVVARTVVSLKYIFFSFKQVRWRLKIALNEIAKSRFNVQFYFTR